jgi:beta-glucosidase
VVQAYLAGPQGNEDGEARTGAGTARPPRALAAFATVSVQPGAVAEVALRVPARAFARWDSGAGGWVWPPGRFTLHVGRSSRDLRLATEVRLG